MRKGHSKFPTQRECISSHLILPVRCQRSGLQFWGGVQKLYSAEEALPGSELTFKLKYIFVFYRVLEHSLELNKITLTGLN